MNLTYPCPMPWWASARSSALQEEGHVVERLRCRDEAAFEQLVSEHEREVFQLARRMLGDHEEALEATQEAFLRAFRGLPSFRGQATLRTWLYGITLNVCRNRLSSAYARSRRRSQPLMLVDETGEEHALPVPDPTPDPEQIAYGRELRSALESALAAVSSEHREIVLLRDVHGLDYGEIAATLGCPLGTVKSRLGRARGALREALKEVWP